MVRFKGSWSYFIVSSSLFSKPYSIRCSTASNNATIYVFFSSRIRCNRFGELKCCSRRSRVAPAEAAVCCPPERRFGAICRRLFGSCKCKRNVEAERKRSIRAKHSLTSVAPPPLSEVILQPINNRNAEVPQRLNAK